MSLLVVDEFGCFLGKSGSMVQVRKQGTTLLERPLDELSCINLEGRGISLSVDLIHECALRGVPINFLASDGEPYAKLMSPMLTATVETRRAQLLAYDDLRGLQIAQSIADAKIANQRGLLLYAAKYRRKTDPQVEHHLNTAAQALANLRCELSTICPHTACATPPSQNAEPAIQPHAPQQPPEGEQTSPKPPPPSIDHLRPSLLNIEGRAGAIYWDAIWKLIPQEICPGKREHQGATDPFNAMLNYGYGILYLQCWTAILLAGLDPFAGFIHVDRPGKPSLVLDLQEIFRQPVVDRTVLAMVNKGFRPAFEEEGRLDKASRRQLASHIIDRLETVTPHHGQRHTLKTIIVQQARALAVAVRGEKPFKAYIMKW